MSASSDKTLDDKNLMDHNYDGIQEYDNPAPGWWSGIFIGTVVFSLGYWIYFSYGPGMSEIQSYDAEMAAAAAAAPVAQVTATEDSLAALTKNPEAMAKGAEIYMIRCFSCHQEGGKGLVGPNLTDDYQIHGSTRMDMLNTVINGVPEKGMISWGLILPPEEIEIITAYVSTFRHTNVPGGKAPEGDKVEPFPE
jgi:cytochrome c oxidase cbb3-type subunit 3